MSRNTGRRFHGAIATKLGSAIVSGVYAPGTILTGEVAFSEKLDVSRTAYRESVRVLSAKGLVESRPKIGTRVLPRDRWNLLDPDVLAWSFATEKPDMSLVRSLFELRAIIEPAAAAFAAERRDDDDLRRICDAFDAMREHGLATDDGQLTDREFHRAILYASRNDALVTLSVGIGAAVRWTTQFKQRSGLPPRDALPDHARVYEGIAAGRPDEARDAMRALVDLALDDTRRAGLNRGQPSNGSTTTRRPRRKASATSRSGATSTSLAPARTS